MKRSSAGGLIVAVLVVTALGLAGWLVPLRRCPSCDGSKFTLEWGGTPSAKYRPLGCPDCANQGKRSLFKSWTKPIVSEPVAILLRALFASEDSVSLPILKQLIKQDGKDPVEFLHGISSGSSFSEAGFIEAERKHYLVLLTDIASGTTPGNVAIAVVLLSPEGRALDQLEITGSIPNVELTAQLLETMSPDGTWITIRPDRGGAGDSDKSRMSFQVIQRQRSLREGFAKVVTTGGQGPCRLGIRGDAFELLTPVLK